MRKYWLFILLGVTVSGLMLLLALQGSSEGSQSGEIIWGRQFGSASEDIAFSATLDNHGNVIIAGRTKGSLFGKQIGDMDIFVVKFDQNGNQLWGKQSGTEREEEFGEVATDGKGNIYVLGMTYGNWFGKNAGKRDVILIKFSPAGESVWGKQFGTNGDEVPLSIAVDNQDCVYVVGGTRGSLLGQNSGLFDAFVVKFDADGNALWGRQLGTPYGDNALGVAVDHQRNVYVAGETIGDLFGKREGQKSIEDGFIVKFSHDGYMLWGKQFSLGETDRIIDTIGINNGGSAYVLGCVITKEGVLSNVFIAKYDFEGNQQWFRQLSAEKREGLRNVAVDGEGNIYAVGYTQGSSFGDNLGMLDIIVAKYSTTGELVWGKQFGTDKYEVGCGIIVDSQGNVYIAGWTDGSFFTTNTGEEDAFIFKLKP